MKTNTNIDKKNNLFFLLLFLFGLVSFSQSNIYDVCRKGSFDDIKELYSKDKTIINVKDKNGYLPLTLACYYSNLEVVSFLINKVETIDGNSKFGTPLMAASVKGNLKIVKLLLKHNAKVNLVDAQGISALHYATMFKNKALIQLLIDAGANPNLKDNNGKSALDHAMILKEDEIIQILKS